MSKSKAMMTAGTLKTVVAAPAKAGETDRPEEKIPPIAEGNKEKIMSKATIVIGMMLAVAAAGAGVGRAAVIVTENIGDSTETSWPATPTIQTNANPQTFNQTNNPGDSGPLSGVVVSQTFTAASSFTLGSAVIRYNTTGTGGTYTLHLQAVSDARASTYTAGTDLLSGLTFSTTINTGGYGASAARFLRFDFSGTDNIQLTAGTSYALEIVGNSGTTTTNSLIWDRNTGDGYAGGEGYYNRTAFGSVRQRGLAVYAVPEPASLGVLAMSGLALLRRRRSTR